MKTELCQSVCDRLQNLYDSYGYSLYTMSKFEEYDLYAKNRDFLISGQVITFTDLNGSLLALKPDVTLSIVKNTADGESLQKLYYQENVYRAPKGSGFREILQMGLECLGQVDDFTLSEVLTLAGQSLSAISSQAVLDISDLGILEKLLDRMGIQGENRAAALNWIGQKNRHELSCFCQELGTNPQLIELLQQLLSLRGTPDAVLPSLRSLLGAEFEGQLQRLEQIFSAVETKCLLNVDFSVVDDPHYYNGLVFKGFVDGIPSAVLSGGQYDKLMRKMKRSSRAVGFAVYMDLLEQLQQQGPEFDVDTVLLYDGQAQPRQIRNAADALRAKGKRVLALQTVPPALRYQEIVKLEEMEC